MERSDAWLLTENLHLQHGQADPFSAAIRSTRMAMIVTDPCQFDNPIIFANDAFLALTGYAREEVTGRNCRFMQGPQTDPASVVAIRHAIAESRDIAIDILNYKKDGSTFWNALYLSPVPNAQGVAQYFFASQLDATDRKTHETATQRLQQELDRINLARTNELEDALRRSTLLLHEVDHRVKNNLQMISAMLMLQSLSIPDAGSQATLQEMLGRVDAMGLVHKRLYESDSVADFDIAEFTREIAQNLVASTGRDDIKLVIEATRMKIKADEAACVALVVNEIITNALKHGLAARTSGELTVKVAALRDGCEISIGYDGPDMPADSPQRSGFGKTLIDSLIQQLGASIAWRPACPGTLVTITLPLS